MILQTLWAFVSFGIVQIEMADPGAPLIRARLAFAAHRERKLATLPALVERTYAG